MPRVLVLAATTGYQTRAFGDAATHLGIELAFATDRCDRLDDPWRDGAIPVRFHQEGEAVEAVLASALLRRFDGVIAVGDRPTVIAARVAEALGIPWHSPAAASAARNKRLTRERLQAAGLLTPRFVEYPLDGPADSIGDSVTYPAVIKPLALSGSRGVMRVDTREELRVALARLRILLASADLRAERNPAHERVLIEAFIPGREYAIEGLMNRGVLDILAIFDKPDPLDGPFFEETIYVTPSGESEETQRAIAAAIDRAAAALGLSHGPVHAECRVNGEGVFVLEVAARPIGGLCSRVLRFVARERASASSEPEAVASLEELLLRHALGEPSTRYRREPEASGVMMIPIPSAGIYRGVDGVDAARAVSGIEDIRMTAKRDQRLLPLPEGASYLGLIFARSTTASAVENALRRAHGRLVFSIVPEVRMLQSFHG